VYPPYTDEVKGQILKTLKMGVVTQSGMARFFMWFTFIVTAAILFGVYYNDIEAYF
jgi:hypothetical protein